MQEQVEAFRSKLKAEEAAKQLMNAAEKDVELATVRRGKRFSEWREASEACKVAFEDMRVVMLQS